jgi:TonB-dependent receptor
MLKQCRHAAYDEPRLWWRTTLLVSTALALVTVQAVQAQTTKADAPAQPASANVSAAADLSEVTVTAERDPYASSKAIETKRDLSVVSDGISDSQISGVPVFSLGDALAAVPGVSFAIDHGQGEDEFMTIRGLNPDYNTVTIDGMPLPSTEETVRSLSFNVFPAYLISQASVYKTWTVDQPSDAVGGVTNLTTRSAFDNPGPHVFGHVDPAYSDQPQQLRSNKPSGAADLVLSDTFGPSNEFGVLAMGSYYNRSSETTNITTSNFAYYTPPTSFPATNVFGLDQTSRNAVGETLHPSQNVAGLIAVPQTHQWYYYDNDRQRSGEFLRFDYNHTMWHAALSGGYFDEDGNFNRDYQYIAGEGPATLLTPTTGSWAEGVAGLDSDHFHDVYRVSYVDFNGSADFNANTQLDLNANYGVGHYRQDGTESPFTEALSTNLATNFNLAAPGAPLLTPTGGAYMNPALYNYSGYLVETDQSLSKLPQIRIDFKHNVDAKDMGFGYSAGLGYRDLSQTYSYYQTEWNPIVAPTLATTGTLNQNVNLINGAGQTLLLQNPSAAAAYVFAHPANFRLNSGDALANQVNDYTLNEAITDGYEQAQYRDENLMVLLGLREEWTREAIKNFLPSPLSSRTNFVEDDTTQSYLKLLPSLNVSYKPLEDMIVRAAVTRDLARAEYGQLAENSSASLTTSAVGGTASETISNPHLMPREATNYDLSLEYYPAKGVLASVAVFYKDISHEIVTLTNTQQGVTIPGYGLPVILTTTQSQNATTKSSVDGVEFDLVDARFDFLPGLLSGLGARANAAFMNFDAPYILMSDGTLRHLPQLLASSKMVINAAVSYTYQDFHTQVSWNHTSKQPISFDTNNAANDQWWATIDTVNAQIGYQITPNLDFRFQVQNLTNAMPQKVIGPNQNLNLSLEENGRVYYAGIAFHY